MDARDPLFYRSQDLERYAKELHVSKQSVLLLNKADLLPVEARRAWSAYFDSLGLAHYFWSAKAASEETEAAAPGAALPFSPAPPYPRPRVPTPRTMRSDSQNNGQSEGQCFGLWRGRSACPHHLLTCSHIAVKALCAWSHSLFQVSTSD